MMLHRPAGAAAVLVLTVPLGPDAALGGPHLEPLWLGPATSCAAAPAGLPEALALLSLPPAWSAGDTTAIVVGDRPSTRKTLHRLAAALGPGGLAFAAGTAPPAEESWSVRAPLLCAALTPPADPPTVTPLAAGQRRGP